MNRNPLKSPFINIGRWIAPALAAGCIFAATASAQTSVGSLFRPWPGPQRFDGQADALFLNNGQVKRSDDNLQLSIYHAEGRWRLDDTHKINPTLGFETTWLDLDTQNPALPDQLQDWSIGFGTPIAKSGDWFFAATAAVGYAGDTPFGDANAWYPKAAFLMGRQFGKDETLIWGIDFDGNRTLMPDIPLPGMAYTRHINKKLLLVAGFPYSSLQWQPLDRVRLDAAFTFPSLFEATASYQMAEAWRIYVSFKDVSQAYHVAGFDGDRRIFFQQRRAEAGLRWNPAGELGIVFAAGYAFDQQFDRGFDTRNLSRIARISDEPYMRVGVEWRY